MSIKLWLMPGAAVRSNLALTPSTSTAILGSRLHNNFKTSSSIVLNLNSHVNCSCPPAPIHPIPSSNTPTSYWWEVSVKFFCNVTVISTLSGYQFHTCTCSQTAYWPLMHRLCSKYVHSRFIRSVIVSYIFLCLMGLIDDNCGWNSFNHTNPHLLNEPWNCSNHALVVLTKYFLQWRAYSAACPNNVPLHLE